MNLTESLMVQAISLGKLLQTQQLKIALAESCTGGLIAQTLTAIAGSSAWFERGFVTYSNAAKIQMLGVKPQTLNEYGAVSAEIAVEMIEGALLHSEADCAISVTGIAGPDGGTLIKPVGTVFIAFGKQGYKYDCQHCYFKGDRQTVRLATAETALRHMHHYLSG